jgi:hypothetical protein
MLEQIENLRRDKAFDSKYKLTLDNLQKNAEQLLNIAQKLTLNSAEPQQPFDIQLLMKEVDLQRDLQKNLRNLII